MGRRNGARCELWIVDTPWRVCHERDRQRDKPSSIQWVECAALVSAAKRDAYKDGWDAGHLIEREAQIALDNE
jgi:hypothetical protein